MRFPELRSQSDLLAEPVAAPRGILLPALPVLELGVFVILALAGLR